MMEAVSTSETHQTLRRNPEDNHLQVYIRCVIFSILPSLPFSLIILFRHYSVIKRPKCTNGTPSFKQQTVQPTTGLKWEVTATKIKGEKRAF
jgi:hypothetical protein